MRKFVLAQQLEYPLTRNSYENTFLGSFSRFWWEKSRTEGHLRGLRVTFVFSKDAVIFHASPGPTKNSPQTPIFGPISYFEPIFPIFPARLEAISGAIFSLISGRWPETPSVASGHVRNV